LFNQSIYFTTKIKLLQTKKQNKYYFRSLWSRSSMVSKCRFISDRF